MKNFESENASPQEAPQSSLASEANANNTSATRVAVDQNRGFWQKKTTRRTALFGGLGTLALAGAGGAWGYNRYIADHAEITDVAAYEAAAASSSGTAAAATELTNLKVTDSGATADNGSITINKIVNGSDSDTVTAFSAEIKLDDATLLKSAFANNEFGLNIIDVPTAIASEHNAIWAINGDYYGFRETGIVIRNGVVYRDAGAREGLAFYRDGSVKIYDETTTDAQTLVDAGVWNTLSFGPSLISDGAVAEDIEDYEVDTNVGNHSIQGEQPRTGIGVLGDNHLMFLAVDGRSEGYSRGVTMTEFAQMFIDLGCTTAYNIDGGGSTDMVFNGSVVNNPLGKGEERGTSDILYIAGTAS